MSFTPTHPLAGEHDPQKLAQLKDPRIKASAETIAKALVGGWRAEHLFTLRQSLAAYRYYLQLLQECGTEIERMLEAFDSRVNPREQGPPAARNPRKKCAGHPVLLPAEDLRTELYRILGVDFTQVPGLQATSVHTLFAELGPDLSAFPTARHFCSWLGLCPDNRVSGGKVLSARTRKVRSRVANTLRLAAQALWHGDNPIAMFYRRMPTKLWAPKAITATALKLARIIYRLLTTQTPYDETIYTRAEEQHRQQRVQRLRRDAAALGFHLSPAEGVS